MEEPIVTVEQGKLRGKTGMDYDGRNYYSFQGIPYAKPPLGKLRFKSPRLPEPWQGIRDATKEGNVCFQWCYSTRPPKTYGSEDCLYLNVYTPNLPSPENQQLLPVMVWVHGGAFTIGSGNSDTYGPQYLLINDVVLVTLNHRLGLLGFLKAEDSALGIPGNAALKDIVMALKWVKANIKHFSGDPDNVTFFGESTGSAVAQYLLLSPLATGLFHKAIMQSGSIFNPWARGYQSSQRLAEILNLPNSDETEVMETLTNLPVMKVLELQDQLGDAFFKCKKRPFGPTVEETIEDPFLTEEPSNIFKSGNYNKVPVIVGYCNREGNMNVAFANMEGKTLVHADWKELVPYDLDLPQGSLETEEVARKIKEFYYKDQNGESTETFSILEGDLHFLIGISRSVKMMLETLELPLYYYRFSIDTKLNMLKKYLPVSLPGASHGDDLGYLFKSECADPVVAGSKEDIAIRRLTKLWTNFAKTGDPNSKEKDQLLDILWKPATKNELNFLDFDQELTVGVDPDGERLKFWEDIYKGYAR